MKATVLALYLPQFHPTPDNDLWWGEGFTEWTNVAKASKLYRGHYQPRIPGSLGFYDLRLAEVREKQVEMAKQAGVSAFCYYHYWFGEGKEELERPFKEVVSSGKPDFPFCLCWANTSWELKQWNIDGTSNNRTLCEQRYPGPEDNEKHFFSVLNALKDSRYFKINGKPVFMVTMPLLLKDATGFINQWNALAKNNGIEGFYFIGQIRNPKGDDVIAHIKKLGFDAVNVIRLDNFEYKTSSIIKKSINYFSHQLLNRPYINNYERILGHFINKQDEQDDVFPTIVPNWDHTPRSGRGGYLYENCEPYLFEKHCRMVFDEIKNKPDEKKIVILKSWNEWGEGNYMEPDLRYGYGYINALARALSE